MIFHLLIIALSLFVSAPSAPLNFELSPLPDRPTELEANWTTPAEANGIIQNYTVECNDSLVFPFDVSDGEIGSSNDRISTILENLDPFTVYECTVLAATDGGIGNASEPSVATTEQDGQ